MAIVFNCAQDWTFDLFVADAAIYSADSAPSSDDYRGDFMVYLKRFVRKFEEDWTSAHDGKLYADHEYIGDAFGRELVDSCFSDCYKDAYGQRPHLPLWYYVHVLDLPQTEDAFRTFCADPIEDAMDLARGAREAVS